MSIKKTPFKAEQIAPGDIIRERVHSALGTMRERARWLVIDKRVPYCHNDVHKMERKPVFNCVLLSFNAESFTRRWHIGQHYIVSPDAGQGQWDVVVESGLSWGDQ